MDQPEQDESENNAEQGRSSAGPGYWDKRRDPYYERIPENEWRDGARDPTDEDTED